MVDHIRQKVEQKYGIELLTPKETDAEIDNALREDALGTGRKGPRVSFGKLGAAVATAEEAEAAEQARIRADAKPGTVADLIIQMQDAANTMSPKNPHRQLMLNAANTLNSLCDIAWKAEQEKRPWLVRIIAEWYARNRTRVRNIFRRAR